MYWGACRRGSRAMSLYWMARSAAIEEEERVSRSVNAADDAVEIRMAASLTQKSRSSNAHQGHERRDHTCPRQR